MARVAATMTVVYNDFPALPRRVRREVDRAAQRSADRVAAGAKRNTHRVRTGAMRDGWHAEETGQPAERVVTNDVPYTIYHELGTAHIAPAPMLGPAVADERHSGLFEREIGDAIAEAVKR